MHIRKRVYESPQIPNRNGGQLFAGMFKEYMELLEVILISVYRRQFIALREQMVLEFRYDFLIFGQIGTTSLRGYFVRLTILPFVVTCITSSSLTP